MRRPDLFVNDVAEMAFHCNFHQNGNTGTIDSGPSARPMFCPVHRDEEIWFYSTYFNFYKCPKCPEPVREPLVYKCPVCVPGEPLPPALSYVSGTWVPQRLRTWEDVNVLPSE